MFNQIIPILILSFLFNFFSILTHFCKIFDVIYAELKLKFGLHGKTCRIRPVLKFQPCLKGRAKIPTPFNMLVKGKDTVVVHNSVVVYNSAWVEFQLGLKIYIQHIPKK